MSKVINNTKSASELAAIVQVFISTFYPINDLIFHVKAEELIVSVLIMDKMGKSFCRAYWYNDDDTIIYLDWLSVFPEARNNGIGTKMQIIREQLGNYLGFKTACLWVVSDSWMHEWYLRRGYVNWIKHKTETNAIWMRKSITS